MCKILIEIEGGCIQSITTDRDMTIVVIDRDNIERDENDKLVSIVSHYEPDTILPGGENFSTVYGESIDEQDKAIYDDLKKLGL